MRKLILLFFCLLASFSVGSGSSDPLSKYACADDPNFIDVKVHHEYVRLRRIVMDDGAVYYISVCEVTEDLWNDVMGLEDKDSRLAKGHVSMDSVAVFLSKIEQITKLKFDLPTVSQWEYAAYASDTFEYAGSPNIEEVAWWGYFKYRMTCGGWFGLERKFFDDLLTVTARKTGPFEVACLKPNKWGLYDMSGNEEEWCKDSLRIGGMVYSRGYGDQWERSDTSEFLPARALKGGSWFLDPDECAISETIYDDPERKNSTKGFRLVINVKGNEK